MAIGLTSYASASPSNLGIAIFEQLDHSVFETREAIEGGSPFVDAGFARTVADLDFIYKATLGHALGLENFAIPIEYAIFDNQIFDLTTHISVFSQAHLASGDALIGSTLGGSPLDFELLEIVTGWIDLTTLSTQ